MHVFFFSTEISFGLLRNACALSSIVMNRGSSLFFRIFPFRYFSLFSFLDAYEDQQDPSFGPR